MAGSFVSCCLLRRPLLSLLFKTFKFVQTGKYDVARKVPNGVLLEMSALLDCAPLMGFTLRAETSDRVYWTDASRFGGGVVYARNVGPDERAVLSETLAEELWRSVTAVGAVGAANASEAGEMADAAEGVVAPFKTGGGKAWSVSPAFREFFDGREFTKAFDVQWRRGAHINELEMEALFLALKHTKSSASFSHKHGLYGLDSAVALGVLRKGRSSSRRLNFVARRICAVILLGDLWPAYFWTPTDLQPADEPSRPYNCLKTLPRNGR